MPLRHVRGQFPEPIDDFGDIPELYVASRADAVYDEHQGPML